MNNNELISIKHETIIVKKKKGKKINFLFLFFIIIIICIIIYTIELKSYFNNKIGNNFETKLEICYKTRAIFYMKGRQIYMRDQNMTYNESNLITIQDKLNYLTIHEFPDYKSKLVDKINLHQYSKKILGKDICVPILKIYKHSNEINLNELPDKFVLKCNHGVGMNIICNNKNNFKL